MEIVLQEFAQQVLLNLVPIVVPLVITMIGKLCVDIWQTIKRQKPDIAFAMEQAADFGIHAAEQVNLSGALATFADSKLDYATEMAKKYLQAQGITKIDLELLRAAIEAEVKRADFPHGDANSKTGFVTTS